MENVMKPVLEPMSESDRQEAPRREETLHSPRQHTLAEAAEVEGIGLHSGRPSRLRFLPAPPGTGVVWRRVDLPGRPAIVPGPFGLVDAISRSERATTLSAGEASVLTVEHVMAALAGLGIDNVIVEVNGPEVPLLDGSAAGFCACLQEAGVVAQKEERAWPALTAPVYYEDGDAVIVALPARGLRISYTFVSDHPALGCQFAEFALPPGEARETYAARFSADIAPPRTIGWLREVEALWARGLAKGASMDSAVVVGETGLITPLRLPHEVARHKVLDLLGDLYLLGPLQAHIVALRSGHRHHAALARLLKEHLPPFR